MRLLHRAAAFITALWVTLTGILPVCADTSSVVRIGILRDGPGEHAGDMLNLFQQEILQLTEGEFDVQFPEDKILDADWTVEGVRGALDRLFADPEVRIVLALGVLASHEVCSRDPIPKPAIAPIVIDADLQGLPQKDGASGVKNLSYIGFPHNIQRDITGFREIVPFDNVAVLFNEGLLDFMPDLAANARGILETIGIDPYLVPVGRSIDDVLKKLPPHVEACYLAPLHHLPPGGFDKLVRALIDRKTPSFSLMGRPDVERGVLASLNPDILPRLARRVALNVQRILLGEDAGTLQATIAATEQMTINMATARAIGVYPSWNVLTEAVLINERRDRVERIITLQSVVREAIASNLVLAAKETSVAAGRQEVGLARSNLLPQVDLSLLGAQIDKDRAESSAGQQAERTLSGSVVLNQTIFSEPAWANLSIQRHLQKSRESDRDILKLDIAKSATVAYLSVLRANTFESIQKENLRRTRANLQMARLREAIGTARPAEVLRWESELANNRKVVIEANAQRNLAEMVLNRLLHRPVEENFMTEEADLDDPQLLLSGGRLLDYMDNPWDFRILRAFMVKEALDRSPEILALDEAIAAEERGAASATRAFWLPTIGLQAEISNAFLREGAGSEFDVGGIPPALSGIFSEPEDLSWNIGISVRYPLFSGGAKFAERRRSLETLSALRLERAAAAEQIEQRTRSALHLAGASHAGIKQARLSAEAANSSLELVEDAYSSGAATILDVLDAQNNALVADEVAANAVYDFLIDLMEVERSIGRLVLQMEAAEREAFFTRLDAYFEQAVRR
jgi:outer membrane protein TolC